jgi:hypothetical protein
MNTMFKVVTSRVWLVALVLLVSVSMMAQVQNGVFTGTVTDPSGAAVTGATVTIQELETGYTTTATTTNTGLYTSVPLPVGTYKISIAAAGFKTAQKSSLKLDVGTTQRQDFKLTIGEKTETVEVTAEAPAVNTEDSKLSANVSSTQIASLPLNGRNVYDLIQLAPGSTNVKGVLSENGAGTVVNGVREDFNGFMVNGVSNKGLSGGFVNQPIQDTVQEFQLLTLNNSAQYGNSAGAITNLVTKSGTNNFHGTAFEFLRNDVLDANDYFNKDAELKSGAKNKPNALRFNQFGGTFGGPIIKDKLFFFLAYQEDRFKTSSLPSPVLSEGPEFRAAVAAAFPNSISNLLYSKFAPALQGSPLAPDAGGAFCTINPALNPNFATDPTLCTGGYVGIGASGSGFTHVGDYLCDANVGAARAVSFASLLGVTAADQAYLASAGCTVLPLQAGTFNPALTPFLYQTVNVGGVQIQPSSEGNLFNGHEASGRIDWNIGQKDRIYASYNWQREHDAFAAGSTAARGFKNPTDLTFPQASFVATHIFSPNVVNEFKAGYTGNLSGFQTNFNGVPAIGFDDGTLGFGSYNGYPQFFKENIYNYGDMVSWTKGKHSIHAGVDIRRNIENSEFNVGRPSYYFLDPLFFAIDAPYGQASGVNPDLLNGSKGANAHLESNIRHFRNIEIGGYFQDDWKVLSRLTLNLGLRYDLFTRHSEENGLTTTFMLGPGKNIIDNISTGSGQIKDANAPIGTPACDPAVVGNRGILAGVCGPGGFAPSKSLGAGDHNDFGPHIGFAWDVFGNGKTALRGGFGVSYEGTLYNPLSNSRWNPPYYSFNSAFNDLGGSSGVVRYGPASCGTGPNWTCAPSFTGPADPNNHQGTQPTTATGNIQGWDPSNPDQAVLTGIVFPQGIKDPYVYNYNLGVQHEFMPKWSFELGYVGTAGHKLFRAQQANRIPGSVLPAGDCVKDIFGRTLCSQRSAGNPSGRRLNPNYGRLRVWENVNNSDYNGMQFSLKKQASHGLAFNVNYTWSHSIDNGSTWHSGATSSNGAAAGEGYSLDQTLPGLDRGNSIFDVRHRIVGNYVWELPWYKNNRSALGWIAGGWQLNGIVSYQSGAHWEPFCNAASSCDYNGDGERNDRPDASALNYNPSRLEWTNGWTNGPAFTTPCNTTLVSGPPTASCAGSYGNEGRNTFVGPSYWTWDPSLFKNFKFTERVGLQFRAEMFNVLNKTNFQLPGAKGSGNNNIKSPSFGQAGGTFNPRQIQLGLRLSF